MDNIAAATRMVSEDQLRSHASISLNGQLLVPTLVLALELLKRVVGHPPIRIQPEAVRAVLESALAACYDGGQRRNALPASVAEPRLLQSCCRARQKR